MKKKFSVLLLCAVLCLSAVLLAACGEDPPPETPHTHAFGEWTETRSATCTAAGELTRSCACGATETAPAPATGIHTYGTDNVCTSCGVRLAYTEGLVLTPIEDGAAFAVTHIGTATAEQIVLPAYHEGKPVKALQGLLVKNGTVSTQRITGLEISATVVSVDPKALEGTVLTSLTVAADNPVYHSAGNCLIETATKTLIAGCLTSSIPANGSVTAIGTHAFYKNTALTTLTVPHGVMAIAPNAFEGCSALTSVVLESSDATADPTQPNPLLDGWYICETAEATAIVTVEVSDGAAVAAMLTETYKSYYWYRDVADDSVRY